MFLESQIYEWSGIAASMQFPSPSYNEILQSVESQGSLSHNESLPLIRTGQISQYLKTLSVWLREQKEQHFLIYGPNGSAKTSVSTFFY